MKTMRHVQILELISNNDIETQEDLLRLLNENGFRVTQATVSRDIKELKLVKVQMGHGGYKYSVNAANDNVDMSFKFHAVFSESVTGVDCAENIVVIKCYVGMANAACAALDSVHWHGVVGTIAGDDTILCVMRDKSAAGNFMKQLQKLADRKVK